MFTTGSKLFLGATALALVAHDRASASPRAAPSAGRRRSACSASPSRSRSSPAINFFVRDGNVSAMDADAITTSAAAQDPPATACGRSSPRVGLGADRRRPRHRADRVHGRPRAAARRDRRVDGAGLERAGLGRSGATTPRCASACCTRSSSRCSRAIGLGVVIYSFSRIMLFISKTHGPGDLRHRRRARAARPVCCSPTRPG